MWLCVSLSVLMCSSGEWEFGSNQPQHAAESRTHHMETWTGRDDGSVFTSLPVTAQFSFSISNPHGSHLQYHSILYGYVEISSAQTYCCYGKLWQNHNRSQSYLIPSTDLMYFNGTYVVFSENVCVNQEQLKVIYQAQIESLEAQVISLRSEYSIR